jgi:hypothetical protein
METDWHRLFGLVLTDFFTDTPFRVEVEKDLSLKKQLLDVVIVRKGPGTLDRPLPDGFDDLAPHNLITFKSYQEALDDWALKELTGHYVNYRKQVSPSLQNLLPEADFRLFAVTARYPHNLAGQAVWAEVRPGVYDCRRGTDVIRVLVAGQLPRTENNALLHLFSAAQEQVRYGRAHYQQRSAETSTLLYRLLQLYEREGLNMPYTMADFVRDFTKEHLKDLTPEERVAGLSPEERVAGLSPEEKAALLKRLQGELPPPADSDPGPR